MVCFWNPSTLDARRGRRIGKVEMLKVISNTRNVEMLQCSNIESPCPYVTNPILETRPLLNVETCRPVQARIRCMKTNVEC